MATPPERTGASPSGETLPASAPATSAGSRAVVVDPDSAIGPAEQIRSQLVALIQSGELAADTRLPPVRQLAGDLRLAVGTVARAYKELEAAGLVRTGRAAGTRVNPGQELSASALADALAFVRTARRAGMTLEQAQGLVAVGWQRAIP